MMTGRKKVLIVEDDEQFAKMLQLQLEASGLEVHVAADGGSALSWAVENTPGLVILDVRLPDMSGYAVCKQLRKQRGPWEMPPILMLTGMTEPIDQLRGFAHGADAYLTKPCSRADLLKAIDMICE